jgi:hypothetical protein
MKVGGRCRGVQNSIVQIDEIDNVVGFGWRWVDTKEKGGEDRIGLEDCRSQREARAASIAGTAGGGVGGGKGHGLGVWIVWLLLCGLFCVVLLIVL